MLVFIIIFYHPLYEGGVFFRFWANSGLIIGPIFLHTVSMPETVALLPQSVKLTLNQAGFLFLTHLARKENLSLQDYMRVKAGLRPRPLGRPSADELADLEDRAWEMLRSAGLDPKIYFPAQIQPPSEEEDRNSPERLAINAKLREFNARHRAEEAARKTAEAGQSPAGAQSSPHPPL